MADRVDKYILGNGIAVLCEEIEGVGSAAFYISLPCGESTLPAGSSGAGEVISDWLFRGAGKRDSRELVDVLDGLGIHRGNGAGSMHLSFSGALEAGNLLEALEIYSDIILRPMLKKDQFELSKQLSMHDLSALDDNPQQKVMINLVEQFYPSPFGRSCYGNAEELGNLTAEKAAEIIRMNFNPSQMRICAAGKYDFDKVCGKVEEFFGGMASCDEVKPEAGSRGKRYFHEHRDGAQVHIGLMTETVPASDKDYYNAIAAVSVLSGGMSSRLFTEVREKRGLCYAVRANYKTLKEYAGVACYAGTVPEKAQETVDVILSEFGRLGEGISEEEIETTKTSLKSNLVMQGESSSSRSGGLSSDHYLLGRVRSLEEIKEKINELSVDSVMGFLKRNPFKEFTFATIGPKEVQIK